MYPRYGFRLSRSAVDDVADQHEKQATDSDKRCDPWDGGESHLINDDPADKSASCIAQIQCGMAGGRSEQRSLIGQIHDANLNAGHNAERGNAPDKDSDDVPAPGFVA